MGQLLTAEEDGPRLVRRREAVVDQARVVEVGEDGEIHLRLRLEIALVRSAAKRLQRLGVVLRHALVFF